MSIGAKRNRIRIEQLTATADGHGGSALAWSPRCVVWAHERPLSGREAMQAGQATATATTVFEIWHRSDLSVTDRVKVGTRTCEIESVVDPKDDRKELHLLCSEVRS